ncbi:unnamed protein product [Ceratitis capitata]|uniref:(Mediterranean fruit fly) hypothetical protein n=1 Tax=Ceratitis capitata TaxID=7213 RepID=A0A811UX73_CERCA|nr:unnamed protein product [Ceratitis capitata]
MTLDKLASLSDEIHENALPEAHINTVQETTTSATKARFSRLEASISELISALKDKSATRSKCGYNQIGADFLAHFGILSDLKYGCLIDSLTDKTASCKVSLTDIVPEIKIKPFDSS